MPLRGAAQKRLYREPLLTLGDQDVPSWTSLEIVRLGEQPWRIRHDAYCDSEYQSARFSFWLTAGVREWRLPADGTVFSPFIIHSSPFIYLGGKQKNGQDVLHPAPHAEPSSNWYSPLYTASHRRDKAVSRSDSLHFHETGFIRRAGNKKTGRMYYIPPSNGPSRTRTLDRPVMSREL